MANPVNDLIDTLIDSMFDTVIDGLSQIVSNDLAVVLMVMLSLLLLMTGFFLIRDLLGMGLSENEKALRSSYNSWQRNKGTWRGDLYRQEYRQSLKTFHDDSDYEQDSQSDRFDSGGISVSIHKK